MQYLLMKEKMVLQICCLLVLATLSVHETFLVACLGLWPQQSEGRAPHASCMLNEAESSGRGGG